jgi:hypothetical protein
MMECVDIHVAPFMFGGARLVDGQTALVYGEDSWSWSGQDRLCKSETLQDGFAAEDV